MERVEMRHVVSFLKILAGSILVPLGAVVLLAVLPVAAMLLLAGPLLAVAGLIMGLSLVGTVTAVVFAGPPTAVSGGLAVSAIVRDLSS
jgi:hypothetical protein